MPFEFADVSTMYAKDPNLKKEDVKILQEWLTKQPHLPELKELQVILYLHSCYYRLEAAKTAIDNYFTLKTHVPSVFDRLPVDLIGPNLQVGFIQVLPKLTHEGFVILILKLVDFKTENFNCLHLVKLTNMVTSLYFHQNGYVWGARALFDMKGFSLGHLARMDLMALKHIFYHVQEAMPVRIQGLHFINVVPFVDKVIALIKPLLSEELYNMLQFHTPLETVYEHIPKKCLPEEYGGESPPSKVLKEAHINNLIENYDFFEWHDTQKVDESKRLEKQKCGSNIFGVEGTFKKLDLD